MARGPESGIQTQIVRAFRAHYDCWVASNNNGGYRTRTEAYALKDMGTVAGYPDLSIFGRHGSMWMLETKAKIQKRERDVDPFERFHSLSTSQKIVIPELRERGFRIAVTDSVDEAMACAQTMGLGPAVRVAAPPRLVVGF